MILDYAADRSERRDRQIERLRGWTPPGWRAHIATVLDLVRELDSGGSGGA
ncbi:hypothetical protein ACFSTI_02695 [Rhizorhabdus histidinilytica]